MAHFEECIECSFHRLPTPGSTLDNQTSITSDDYHVYKCFICYVCLLGPMTSEIVDHVSICFLFHCYMISMVVNKLL